ncbi:MAG: GNAT family N-acetyltransferase [Pseudonocardia sp.]|nr:GNAT family N-acetyltransferase [Pseudonocardia sp.]
MDWTTIREGDVTTAQHAELATLLRGAFAHLPGLYQGLRTWSGLRPESRVVGRDADGTAAAAGVLRRFIQVGHTDQLVAVVGIVAVRPSLQGRGTGGDLMKRVNAHLADLQVPFGILTCADRHVAFYGRAGWHRLTPPRRAVFSRDDTGEAAPFADEIEPNTLVLPVAAALADWPEGDLFWHCAPI